MAKKRGGLAGIWDRNKKIIKPLASAAGFLVGGPAGSGVVNGFISGVDRPGKGGIGFDVGRGIKGAATGYLAGKAGDALTGGAGGEGLAGLRRLFSGAGMREVGQNASFYGQGLAKTAFRPIAAVGKWAGKDPMNMLALGNAAIGGLNAYGQAQENRVMANQANATRADAEQRARMREMLMPYFTRYLEGMAGGR